MSPTPRFTESQAAWAVEHIIRPMLVEMARRGIPFNGFLYAGLMVSPKGDINVVEFNARMGDPECQSIMRRAEFDFTEFLFALVTGAALPEIRWAQKSAVTVVLAAEGYPAKVVKGAPISGIDSAEKIPGCVVFHAGTSMDSKGSLVVSGGRVLNVTGIGESLDAARRCAYEGAERITFKGHQIRRDIGIR